MDVSRNGDGGRPFSRAQARADGLTDRQVDRRLRSGRLTALRRGVLISSDEAAAAEELTPLHPEPGAGVLPLEVRAALLASPERELVTSHATAARLWGLPRPLRGWPEPQFTATTGTGRRRNGIHVRVAPLASDEIVTMNGVLVTSPVRTVADCLRTLDGHEALAILDAALHRGLVFTDQVLATLGRQRRWPGVARGRRVIALGDGLRESPLESWSAWTFAALRIPAPLWQPQICDSAQNLIGRVDCWWPGVAGEADGRSKYTLAAAERGGDAKAVYQVLHTERQREQRLRDVGADIVRWSSEDVLSSHRARAFTDRLGGALARADRGARFTGRLVLPRQI